LRVQLVIPPPLAFGALSRDATTITEARRKKIQDGRPGTLIQAWRTIRFRLGYIAHLHWNRLVRRAR
jgi:glycosyl transferase, family 25